MSREQSGRKPNSRKVHLTAELDLLHQEVLRSLRSSVSATYNTFKANFYLNLVIVLLGIALILVALGWSISRGIDPLSITFGGLGLANFITVFLLNPQNRLQENLCKLTKMNVFGVKKNLSKKLV